MSALKKTLRRIKKISKKLAKEEREVLLGGLQEYLRQTERLLSKSAESKKASKAKSGKKSRSRSKKAAEVAPPPVDLASAGQPGDRPPTVN